MVKYQALRTKKRIPLIGHEIFSINFSFILSQSILAFTEYVRLFIFKLINVTDNGLNNLQMVLQADFNLTLIVSFDSKYYKADKSCQALDLCHFHFTMVVRPLSTICLY